MERNLDEGTEDGSPLLRKWSAGHAKVQHASVQHDAGRLHISQSAPGIAK
jgi:hypothetical protein